MLGSRSGHGPKASGAGWGRSRASGLGFRVEGFMYLGFRV